MLTKNYHALAGLGEAAPMAQPQQSVIERPFDYVFQIVLTADQKLPDQVLSMNGDADFVVLALCGTQTGNYSLRLRDADGYALSSAEIRNANLVGTRQLPSVMFPELIIPKSAKISIDLTNLTSATNTIEIVFMGLKKYR